MCLLLWRKPDGHFSSSRQQRFPLALLAYSQAQLASSDPHSMASKGGWIHAALLLPTTIVAVVDFVPEHMLAGEEAAVSVSSSLVQFDTDNKYMLALQLPDGCAALSSRQSPCSAVSMSKLRCSVNWASPGAVVAKLQVNGTDMSDTLLHSTFLWFYAQPDVHPEQSEQ